MPSDGFFRNPENGVTSRGAEVKPQAGELSNDWRDKGQEIEALCLKKNSDGSRVPNLKEAGLTSSQSVIEKDEGIGGLECQSENLLFSPAKVGRQRQKSSAFDLSDFNPRKSAGIWQRDAQTPARFDFGDNALRQDQFGVESGKEIEQASLMEVLNR